MARQRWRRERWISVEQEFEDSGMTQREFASRQRLKLATLQGWIYKLRREDDHEEQPLRFVEIEGAESRAVGPGAASVGWYGGQQFVFNVLPEVEYVAALLRFLMDSPEC